MAFIDPKEKTMEVILTQHGRHLLSKGRLIVKYYAFHDDEIDYQAQFNDQTSFYTPANLGSRLLLWLKDSGIFSSPADVWVNEPTALGGGVFTGSSTARPTVTTVNGINSLLFDGVNDQLTGSLNANAYVTTSSFEGAMVVQISSLGTANNSSDTTPYVRPAIIELITGAQIGVSVSQGGIKFFAYNNPNYVNTSFVVPSLNVPQLIQYRLESQNLYLKVGSQAEVSASLGGNISSVASPFRLGCNFDSTAFFSGAISEVIITGQLTPAERVARNSYLANRFNCTF